MATRVHYRHDNPAYLRPAFVQDGIEFPAKEMPAEGDVEAFDDFLTDVPEAAVEEAKALHWNDVDFQILRTEPLDA